MLKFFRIALLAAAMIAVPAVAQEASIKQTIESRMQGAKVDSVTKTAYLGLYEVRIGDDLIYTDEKVSYIFVGSIRDGRTFENLTEARLNALNAVKFEDLPLNQAFKIVKGKGTRQLAYFSDPNCPYCKRFDKDLAQLDDVTIHVFLYPILSPDSNTKARAVWCSPDRAKAWTELMLKGMAPTSDGKCDTPIDKNLALGQKLRVSGTPTVFLINGQRVPGAVPLAQLTKLLDQAGKP